MVETMSPETMSVVSVGDTPRNYTDLHRVIQRQVAKTPTLDHGISTRGIMHIIGEVAQTAVRETRSIHTVDGPGKLIVLPVLGPTGQVHAVQYWLGPKSHTPPPPRRAVGAVWHLDRQVVHSPIEAYRMVGIPDKKFRPLASIAEVLRCAVNVNNSDDVLELLYNPVPGARLRTTLAVPHMAERRLMQWRLTILASEYPRGARWLCEDITLPDAPPQEWPTFEQIGFRELTRRAGSHVAVVNASRASIVHWLSDPAPWIRWDRLRSPVEVFHPADRAELHGFGNRLTPGLSADITVRMLTRDDTYARTTLQLHRPTNPGDANLLIAQFIRHRLEAPSSSHAGTRSGADSRDRVRA
jgi:hypothetical protein